MSQTLNQVFGDRPGLGSETIIEILARSTMLKSGLFSTPASRLLLSLSLGSVPISMLAAAYTTLSPISLARQFIYNVRARPGYDDIDFAKSGLHPERLKLDVPGGGTIYAFYFRRDAQKAAPYVVLINHGQGQLEYHIGEVNAALHAGADALIYDYEGFGASSNEASSANMLKDSRLVYDYLVAQKNYAPEQIILLGSSLGTGVAADLALVRKCAGVVMISPYTRITRAANDLIGYSRLYPRFMFPQPDLTCEPLMKQPSDRPVVLIHGVKDKNLKVQNSRDLAAMARIPCRLVISEKYGHGDMSMEIVRAELVRLIKERNHT